MVQHEYDNWVQEQYREQAAQKDCNVDTAFAALYEQVCFDIGQANEAIGMADYFKVFCDTDHSFRVIAGSEEIRAVFAKRQAHVTGITVKPQPFVGTSEAEARYEAQPVFEIAACMLMVGNRLLSTGQFSQLVLSPVFR